MDYVGQIADFLIQSGCDIEKCSRDSLETPLFLAAKMGNFLVVRLLVYAGRKLKPQGKCPYIDRENPEGTPLSIAVKKGFANVVKFLIDSGCRTNGVFMISALHTAVELSSLEGAEIITRLLIDAGVFIDQQDYYGRTSLFIAVGRSRYSLVDILIKSGCDKEQPDLNGTTPLHHMIDNMLTICGGDVFDTGGDVSEYIQELNNTLNTFTLLIKEGCKLEKTSIKTQALIDRLVRLWAKWGRPEGRITISNWYSLYENMPIPTPGIIIDVIQLMLDIGCLVDDQTYILAETLGNTRGFPTFIFEHHRKYFNTIKLFTVLLSSKRKDEIHYAHDHTLQCPISWLGEDLLKGLKSALKKE
jgi:hypothetical protein